MFVRHVDNPNQRRGAVLAIVLVSLLVAAMLGAGLIKTLVIHRQQMRVLASQQQSFWLAEAGVQRAVRHLEETPDYEGETWEVPAEVLGASRTAQVTVDISKTNDQAGVREVRVAVHLDDGRAQPTGYHREFRYQLPTAEPSEQSEEQEAD